jgi:WD40 repeat protein
MKDTPPVRQESWRKCSPVAAALLLLLSAHSLLAQGSPDIVWQGQHAGYVRYTTFSPDGRQLASGGDDRKNILWQASDGTLTRSITQCSGVGCRGSTFGFYSPDGQQLATAGIKFWRVADGTLVRTLSAGGTIAFSPDWQFIASSITVSTYPSQTRSIALLRSDGSQVWKNSSAGGGATVFSPDGQLIASIGFAGIDLIRPADGTVVRTIVGPRGSNLVFSRDGQFLATNGGAGGSFQWDDTIKIYRVSDGALVRTLSGTGVVTSIAFTPDNQMMISGSWDSNQDSVNGYLPATGSIRFWRLSDGALLKTYDQNTGTSANAISVSPDGKLFSYSHDSTVFVARVPAVSCAYSISPTSADLPVSGGSGSINVTAPAGCNWSAVSRVSWITFTGPTSGTGNGTVNFTAHGGGSYMDGLVIVAEQTFVVRLGPSPCTYTVNPSSATWSAAGGTGSVGVQTPSGCGWTASSNDAWITITRISRDNGGGGLTYSIGPTDAPRTGSLTVAGQTVTIEQNTEACVYTVTSSSNEFGSGGGPGSIAITTQNGCPWTATTDSSWIILGTGNGTGTGSATLTYWVNASDTTATRSGTITAAGQTFTITQTGITCSYSISPANRSFTSDGGSAYINLAASDACSWSATSNASWITVTSGGSGSGWGTIYYSVTANTSGTSRAGTISLAGQTFTVYQTNEATQGSPDIVWARPGHLAQVNAIAFSPDGQLLASASDDHTVKLWRVADGLLVGTLTGHFEEVTSVAFSHDGQMLASGSMDRNIRLWQVSDRSLLRTMGGTEFILGVAFAPNDQELTSGGGYSTNDIKVWRLSDGQNISIIHDQLGSTNSVAYSPDGQFQAAAKANSVATLRSSSNPNGQWLGHDGTVNFVAFSPNSQMLATASDDQSAGLWGIDGLLRFSLNGPSGFVKSVDFSPDNALLLAAGQDYGAGKGTLLFWNAANGSLLRAYTQETSSAVYSAQFSPDGSLFAYGRHDGTVVVARNTVTSSPGPTPSPTPVLTPTPTATAVPTATPVVSPTPIASPSATPVTTPTPAATATATATASATATATATATPTATATATATPTSSATPTATATSTPTPESNPPSQPMNIATRGRVESGDNTMIGGFIISGDTPKKVIVRAIGPSLRNSISGAVSDPILALRGPDGSLIRQNDNWRDDAAQALEIEASGVAPGDDLESAIVATLAAGSYTAMVTGKNGTTGVGLVEIYDLSHAPGSKLANISTRGVVRSADGVLIGGFILGGSSSNAKVLVRAIGPSLVNAGVKSALADPTLELHDGNGALLMSNDNWKSAQQSQIEATGIQPTNNAESAILADLPPGLYTAIVAGKGTSGVGLIEIYNLP